MADETTDDDEVEVVTFTATRECGHYRAEVILQFKEGDPDQEMVIINNLTNALKSASGFVPAAAREHMHEFTQVLEAPTPESIDAAVEQFRLQLQEHLAQHRKDPDDDATPGD